LADILVVHAIRSGNHKAPRSAADESSRLEIQFQSELHRSGASDRTDLAEIQSCKLRNRIPQMNAVSRVKHIRSESQVVAFRNPNFFHQGKNKAPASGPGEGFFANIPRPDGGAVCRWDRARVKRSGIKVGEAIGPLKNRITAVIVWTGSTI